MPEGGFLPVLVLTADATTEVKERALATGAKDFLAKPFDRTEVPLGVSNLLETRAPYGWLEQHNAELQAALDMHSAAERVRLEVEVERKRLAEKRYQSQRPESLGQLVEGIAHDFNNLLGPAHEQPERSTSDQRRSDGCNRAIISGAGP